MTRQQATSIITSMLIAVEKAGFTELHTIAFGHTFAEITIWSNKFSKDLDKVEEILQPLIPDCMTIVREVTTDREVEYLNYTLRYN